MKMVKMIKPKLEVVRFDSADVIATSSEHIWNPETENLFCPNGHDDASMHVHINTIDAIRAYYSVYRNGWSESTGQSKIASMFPQGTPQVGEWYYIDNSNNKFAWCRSQ